MAPWDESTSVLEDTNPVGTLVDEGGVGGAGYCWPVWRVGRVLQPIGGQSLDVTTAKEIGALFAAGQPAAQRYQHVRMEGMERLASEVGGTVVRHWPAHLQLGTRSLRELERLWNPDEILVTYSFVPIVRLPRFLVEFDDCTWQIRESLTICGSPARSKVWVTASLLTYRGRPTDRESLARTDLQAARRTLGRFSGEALETLTHYYLEVLNEDSRCLSLSEPIHFERLATLAETEIVSLASGEDLSEAFNLLEEKGLRWFRSEVATAGVPGARQALDFLEWCEQPGIPDLQNWEPVRPKILAIYADQPACGSVRALVVPRVEQGGGSVARTWYAALTEVRETTQQPTSFPLSESAGGFIAKEYGRYF